MAQAKRCDGGVQTCSIKLQLPPPSEGLTALLCEAKASVVASNACFALASQATPTHVAPLKEGELHSIMFFQNSSSSRGHCGRAMFATAGDLSPPRSTARPSSSVKRRRAVADGGVQTCSIKLQLPPPSGTPSSSGRVTQGLLLLPPYRGGLGWGCP